MHIFLTQQARLLSILHVAGADRTPPPLRAFPRMLVAASTANGEQKPGGSSGREREVPPGLGEGSTVIFWWVGCRSPYVSHRPVCGVWKE